VEEQFYLVYPTLFLLVAGIRTRWSMQARLSICLAIVTAVSFTLSVVQTASSPTVAYFSPFTRAWELAIGALIAVSTKWLLAIPKGIAASLTWVGLAAIAYGAVAEGLQANAALLEDITEDTKGAGILHHRFVAGAAELVVIDEWETAEQFQGFFEGNPKVERVTSAIGVTGPPTVTVYNSFEAAGAI
jgi:hypothetical protein